MKKLACLLVISSIIFLSCKKDLQETLPAGTVLKTGTFVSNSKNTSGKVRVVREANNQLKLVFENLNTGGGPDVRVWLSPSTNANSYQEIGTLKAFSGSFSYDLSSVIDYTTNNKVLIWCEDVAVLFGHAVLE
jgi:hypothetical protein